MKSRTMVAYDKWHEMQEQVNTQSEDADPMRFSWYRSAYAGIRDGISGDLLEIGCGRGEFAVWLAGAAPGVRITGVDFSGAAIKFAQGRASAAARPVRFLVSDAQCLPLRDNSFDWIVSCECLEHVPNPRTMAAEIFRVLKPGGGFCLTTPNHLNGMLLAWCQSWLTGKPLNSGAGVQPIEHFFLFFNVRKYLRDAGLVVDRTASSHYQWLLLPRVDPARLCTREFKSSWARSLGETLRSALRFFWTQTMSALRRVYGPRPDVIDVLAIF